MSSFLIFFRARNVGDKNYYKTMASLANIVIEYRRQVRWGGGTLIYSQLNEKATGPGGL